MRTGRFIAVSAALLIPCFWNTHIQAGDLSSHLYNAWLARQVAAGSLPGLVLKPLWTNVLADWILYFLIDPLGVKWTERIVMCTAVLIFFWGAFYLLYSISQRPQWKLTPCLALLTYGVIYHLGFLNFYISTALCLWSMANLWNPGRRRPLLAAVLMLLAVTAHLLPVLWAACVLGYVGIAHSGAPWVRRVLPMAAFAALTALHWTLRAAYPTNWSLRDFIGIDTVLEITGASQVWLFGGLYLLVAVSILVVWSTLLFARLDEGQFFEEPLIHLLGLCMAAFVLLPTAIQFDPNQHPLTYISQRVSFFAAVLMLMCIAGSPVRHWVTALSAASAVFFFALLYTDTRRYDTWETEITQLVQQLPAGQRVVAPIEEDTRIPGALHTLDRVCIGRCFSYGNYEPSSLAFRLQTRGPNPYVASNVGVRNIEEGLYIVPPSEAPLYALSQTPERKLQLRIVRPGERIERVRIGETIAKESALGSKQRVPRTSN